jgi:outer membrane protein assembly factor BamA
VLVRAEGTTVIVETGDTCDPSLRKGSFSRKAGVLTYSIGVEESNFLGTGRSLGFNYDQGTQRTERALSFADRISSFPTRA